VEGADGSWPGQVRSVIELSTRRRRPRLTETAERPAQNELQPAGQVLPGTSTTDTSTTNETNLRNMLKEAPAEISTLRSQSISSTQIDHS
jgi:hypothetical protein